MKTYAGFLTLIEELKGDMKEIERLQELNSRAWQRIENGARDTLDYGALAYTIHTIYGVLENYFLRISKFFETDLPGDLWHKVLVERMSLDIPGVRPAFIQEKETREQIVELLRFRHRFRNLYGEDLQPEKMKYVQKTLVGVLNTFPKLHEDFCDKLTRIAESL